MIQIPNYEILEEIGRGGFGVVYKARHKQLGDVRAVKIASDPEYVNNLRKEGLAQTKLIHSGIVRVYDMDINHDTPYTAMEYCEGNLENKIPDMSMEDSIEIVSQVLEALDYAHGQGVIHRDIKPSNLLFSKGKVKISDFGVGKVVEQTTLTGRTIMSLQSGTNFAGTVKYMSPEQIEGMDVDARTDILSLGKVFYQMVTGKFPWGMYRKPSELNPRVSSDLDSIILKSIEPEQEDRYQNAGEMLEDLKKVYPGKGAEQNIFHVGNAEGMPQPSMPEFVKLKSPKEQSDQYFDSAEKSDSYDEKVCLLKKCLDLYPSHDFAKVGLFKAHYNEGQRLARNNQPHNAIEAFRAALEMEDAACLHQDMGQMYEGLGKLEDAVREYQKAVELAPSDLNERSLVGAYVELAKQSNITAKLSYYDIALRSVRDKDYAVGQIISAIHSECNSGRHDSYDKKRLLEKAIEIDPRESHSYILLANIYRDEEDFDRALEFYETAERHYTGDHPGDFKVFKAMIFLKKGNASDDFHEEIECYKEAIRLNNPPSAYYNIGITYYKRGLDCVEDEDLQEGVSHIQTAVDYWNKMLKLRELDNEMRGDGRRILREAHHNLSVIYRNRGDEWQSLAESFRGFFGGNC